jgi:hypothetical protein
LFIEKLMLDFDIIEKPLMNGFLGTNFIIFRLMVQDNRLHNRRKQQIYFLNGYN